MYHMTGLIHETIVNKLVAIVTPNTSQQGKGEVKYAEHY